MTRREFDAATKWNWNGAGMASDERRAYRLSRGHVDSDDFIARRASAHARRNTQERQSLDGFRPMLGIASPYRAPAAFRAATGRSLLGM
jgi:hypothetical protein